MERDLDDVERSDIIRERPSGRDCQSCAGMKFQDVANGFERKFEYIVESEVKVDLTTGVRAAQYFALSPTSAMSHQLLGGCGGVERMGQYGRNLSGLVTYDNILDYGGHARYLPRHVLDFHAEEDRVGYDDNKLV